MYVTQLRHNIYLFADLSLVRSIFYCFQMQQEQLSWPPWAHFSVPGGHLPEPPHRPVWLKEPVMGVRICTRHSQSTPRILLSSHLLCRPERAAANKSWRRINYGRLGLLLTCFRRERQARNTHRRMLPAFLSWKFLIFLPGHFQLNLQVMEK